MMLRGSASAAWVGSSRVESIVFFGGSAQNFLQPTLLHLRASVIGEVSRDQRACSHVGAQPSRD